MESGQKYTAPDEFSFANLKKYFMNMVTMCRQSRNLVLIVVFIALFFDNMLMTTIVPIIPDYLFMIDHPNGTAEFTESFAKTNNLSSTTTPYNLITKGHKKFDEEEFHTSTIESHMHEIEITHAKQKWKAVQMNKLSTRVGLMFASKPIVQLMANPFIGPLTNRIGYSIPMFAGFIIMFVSTLTFAFGTSYSMLFAARAVQGIGSACSSVAGLGMLAERYPDDEERGNAMGIALGGLAMGVLIGPPFGGVAYEFFGKEAPFLILASLGVLDGILQLFILQPTVTTEQQEGASLKELILDPYILVTAGAITFANMGIAMMEPSLPIWMINTMHSDNWQLGAAFLPASISYLIGTNLFGRISHKIGRWLCSMIGMIIIGLSLLMVPHATSTYGLIIPNFGLGFAIGMVDSSMMPTMAYLVDIRHSSVYGSVYAIADVAFCLGFAIGPTLSGVLVNAIGFSWMLTIIAVVCILYSPCMYFLKNPPAKEENISLIMVDNPKNIKYLSYNNTQAESSEDNDY